MKRKRVDIKAILRDKHLCRELMIDTIIATQAREGITTTREQAAVAWNKVQRGHPLTTKNVYRRPDGRGRHRACVVCIRMRWKRWWRQNRKRQ